MCTDRGGLAEVNAAFGFVFLKLMRSEMDLLRIVSVSFPPIAHDTIVSVYIHPIPRTGRPI